MDLPTPASAPSDLKVMALGLLNATLMAAGTFFQKLNGVRGGNIFLSFWLVAALLCFVPTFYIANHVYAVGGRMSLFIPMSAATYVLTMLLGRFYFGETVSWSVWIGSVVIVSGVALVARG